MEFFSKTLTRTDVLNRLTLYSGALQHLPGFEGDRRAQDLTVVDEEEKSWVFRFRIRQGRYSKPELSTGWLRFVRSKKLKIGDKIQFFKEEDEATGIIMYKIQVKMQVRVFGAVLGQSPYRQADR